MPYPHTLSIATPAKSHVNAKFMMNVLMGIGPQVEHAIGMNITFRLMIGRSNITHARSICLTQWYDAATDDDMFLWIDADQVFSASDIVRAVKKEDADVVCGVYCDSAGDPNVYMINMEAFFDGNRDDTVLYAATGFMLIKRPILHKLKKWIGENDGDERMYLGAEESDIIPFFQTRFIEGEGGPREHKHWLGEDYSFCWLVRQVKGTIRAFISGSLGHEVLNIKYFRPGNYVHKIWPKNSIVYVCGMSAIPFSPNDEDMGGSEKAVVNICREWAKMPNVSGVTVYGNVTPGVYDGVTYCRFEEFNIFDKFDRAILWRAYGLNILNSIRAKYLAVDHHDIPEPIPDDLIHKIDHIFVKSRFHKSLLRESKMIKIVPNGLEDDVINAPDSTTRIPNRFIYASSYFRGLDKILKYCWPKIRKAMPDAELHCFYGMVLSVPSEREAMTELLEKTVGAYDHGRVGLQKLIKEKQKASFHIYLTDTPQEIDCLSVRESAYLGCIPLITNEGVFKEREGIKFDIERSGEREEIDDYERVADEICALMKKPEEIEKIRKEVQEKSKEKEMSWADVAKKWLRGSEFD